MDHGRVQVGMTEKLPDRSGVMVSFQQMCGKRMAKRVTGDSFAEPSGTCGGSDRALECRLMQMMPAVLACRGVHVAPCGWKHPLPRPFTTRIGAQRSR